MNMSPEEKNQFLAMQDDLKDVKQDNQEFKSKLDKIYFTLVGNDLSNEGSMMQRIKNMELKYETMRNEDQLIQRNQDKNNIYVRIIWVLVGTVATIITTIAVNKIFPGALPVHH